MAYSLQQLKEKILSGGELDESEAYALLDFDPADLRRAAMEVTEAFCAKVFEPCSIINARSGRCPENCKWCAQSAHYPTTCDTYDIVDYDECMAAARDNHSKGVKRFSLVASGRSVKGKAFERMCEMLRDIRDNVGIATCASLGLLDADQLKALKSAGVNRYHCNLETAPSHFGTLCSTHSIDDKLATIRAAHEAGMEVCSGGIIGMGETRRQRVEFALLLRRARPVSIPVNILQPIPGTPLQDSPLIGEDEILETLAIMRLIHPRVHIRFAGGRARLSSEAQTEAVRIAVNSAIVGDMLTTLGSTIADDREMVARAGYAFGQSDKAASEPVPDAEPAH